MPFVSITRLRVRRWYFMPAFLIDALRSFLQAKKAPGNLDVTLMNDSHRAFWTRTLWTDERAMRGFMLGPPHRQIMTKLRNWCDEASVAHWVQDQPAPPSWREVYERMQREGRAVQVDHPSEDHRAFRVPTPVFLEP